MEFDRGYRSINALLRGERRCERRGVPPMCGWIYPMLVLTRCRGYTPSIQRAPARDGRCEARGVACGDGGVSRAAAWGRKTHRRGDLSVDAECIQRGGLSYTPTDAPAHGYPRVCCTNTASPSQGGRGGPPIIRTKSSSVVSPPEARGLGPRDRCGCVCCATPQSHRRTVVFRGEGKG